MIEEIKDFIIKHLQDDAVIACQENGLQAAIYVHEKKLVEICQLLRDAPTYYFDFLANITAVDFYPEPYFEVVYHLSSIPFQKQLTLKVKLAFDRVEGTMPELDSVAGVWRTADWHEREIFDLMGIYFRNHPDLRRILMPDDWQGFPLRKDYIDPETYHDIPVK